MPAKRPAPKSAKGKKPVSRSAVRKAVARKPEAARARPVALHARKIVAPPRKPPLHPPALTDAAVELKKPPRAAVPVAPAAPVVAVATSRAAHPAPSAEADDGE